MNKPYWSLEVGRIVHPPTTLGWWVLCPLPFSKNATLYLLSSMNMGPHLQRCRRAHRFLSTELIILVSSPWHECWLKASPYLGNHSKLSTFSVALSHWAPPWQPCQIHSQEWESPVDPKNLSQTVQSHQSAWRALSVPSPAPLVAASGAFAWAVRQFSHHCHCKTRGTKTKDVTNLSFSLS